MSPLPTAELLSLLVQATVPMPAAVISSEPLRCKPAAPQTQASRPCCS